MKDNVIMEVLKWQKSKHLPDIEIVTRMGNVITRQHWTAVRKNPETAGGLKVLKGILIGFPGKYDQQILDFIKNS